MDETPAYRAHCWTRWHQVRRQGDVDAIMAARVAVWRLTRHRWAQRVRRPDVAASKRRWSAAGRAEARLTAPSAGRD